MFKCAFSAKKGAARRLASSPSSSSSKVAAEAAAPARARPAGAGSHAICPCASAGTIFRTRRRPPGPCRRGPDRCPGNDLGRSPVRGCEVSQDVPALSRGVPGQGPLRHADRCLGNDRNRAPAGGVGCAVTVRSAGARSGPSGRRPPRAPWRTRRAGRDRPGAATPGSRRWPKRRPSRRRDRWRWAARPSGIRR